MDIGNIITIGIEIVMFAVGYGMLKQEVKDIAEQNKKLQEKQDDIESCIASTKSAHKRLDKLEVRQDTTENVIQSINSRLGSIETKLDLILSGKIIIKEGQ